MNNCWNFDELQEILYMDLSEIVDDVINRDD
jgi:hypothetical protein